jgi:hypothetical protein
MRPKVVSVLDREYRNPRAKPMAQKYRHKSAMSLGSLRQENHYAVDGSYRESTSWRELS